jgi:chorismate mutase/prephenate dehydratase
VPASTRLTTPVCRPPIRNGQKMSESTEDVTVAWLGPAGTYTHAAALRWFGEAARGLPVGEIQDVFAAVETGKAEFGVVPVENSSEGTVTATLDSFINSPLQITGELLLRINHCLLAQPGTDMRQIVRIVSHPQSLGQCRHWLAANLPHVERQTVSSNAEAARQAAQQPGVAAIAGRNAAALYALQFVAESIEDSHDNTTRFLILGRTSTSHATGRDKTSIIISSHNEPGTLFRALEPFHRFGVNLTKLESRPSRKAAWSYSFYVDIEGHVEDAKVQAALAALQQHSLDVKLLGSYPAGAV